MTNEEAQYPRKMSRKTKSRKKVFCNNGKAMIEKPGMASKPIMGRAVQKPSLGKKSILEGKGINSKFKPQTGKKVTINAKEEEAKFTEEKVKKFEELISNKYDDISTVRSGATSLYEVPVDLSLIHISEPTRPLYISYAVFCLKKACLNDTGP